MDKFIKHITPYALGLALAIPGCTSERPEINYSNNNLCWEKTYGGEGTDESQSLIRTVDSGYAIAATTDSKGWGNSDFWLLKYDSKGKLEWDKTYGENGVDVVHSISHTNDEGYILAGDTDMFSEGENDIWVLKLDSKGEVDWGKVIGEFGNDGATAIYQKIDENYFVAGYKNDSDGWILTLDPEGKLVDENFYGGSGKDKILSASETKDLGSIVAGLTDSDAWIFKIDSDGDLEWEKTYGGNQVHSIQQTDDLGYISGGIKGSDSWIFKVDHEGKLEWEKLLDKTYSINSIKQVDDGYVAVGSFLQDSDFSDAMLLRLDLQGKKIFEKVYGGNNSDVIKEILPAGKHYVLAGSTKYKNVDVWFQKMNSNGEFCD